MYFEKEKELFKRLLSIHSEINRQWKEIQSTENEQKNKFLTAQKTLFHYTSLEGLKGIINEKGFWATNLNYMNDTSERKYAHEVIMRALQHSIADSKFSSKFKSVLKGAYSKHNENNYYAVCFTKDGNSLPMWQVYGGSCGVSIELDLTKDYNFIFAPNCFFHDMVYDENLLFKFTCKIIDIYYNIFKTIEKDNDIHFDIIKDDISREISFGILWGMDNFKNPYFSHEKETRLLYRHEEGITDIKFRKKDDTLIPYVTLPIKVINKENTLLPIKSIMVGPGKKQAETMEKVTDFMIKNGYNIEVKCSKIPYRG